MDSLTEKRCSKCGETQPIAEFKRNPKYSDGYWVWCRQCGLTAQRECYARNREARQAKLRANYWKNPEPYKERALKRYHADPQQGMADVRAWQAQNPERVQGYKQTWDQANPERKREHVRKRYARRKGAYSVPFTLAQLGQKMAYWGNRCWICRGPQEAVDHVKPLSKGGAHMLCNQRPICWPCNSRKGNRWPFAA